MLNSIFYVSDLIIKNPFLPTYHNFLGVHKPNPVSPPFSASLNFLLSMAEKAGSK